MTTQPPAANNPYHPLAFHNPQIYNPQLHQYYLQQAAFHHGKYLKYLQMLRYDYRQQSLITQTQPAQVPPTQVPPTQFQHQLTQPHSTVSNQTVNGLLSRSYSKYGNKRGSRRK